MISGKYDIADPPIPPSVGKNLVSQDKCSPNSNISQPQSVGISATSTKENTLQPKPPRESVETGAVVSTPSQLVTAIHSLLNVRESLHPPPFKFEASKEAAAYNLAHLRQHNFDLLESVVNTPTTKHVLCYGSEFKSTAALEQLLQRHPRWQAMKDKLENGASFPAEEISEQERVNDLVERLQRGNHKSAERNADFLASALKKEIAKGWLLPLPASEALSIPSVELAPMGVATHLGINAEGEFIAKDRLTHDLSFPGAYTGESINSRLRRDELEPCMFGYALNRIIHHILHLRQQYPESIIWLRKEDFKSAYRRVHLKAGTAWRSVVRMEIDGEDLLLVSLRLPFGGASCPADFCLISDIITDVINDLLADPSWDHTAVKSSYVTVIPEAKALPMEIPFGQARDLSVDLPIETNGKADVYIDDIISCTVDINDNRERIRAAACTVIHAIAHTAQGETFLERQEFIADDKNDAEGGPEEIKICLGWQLDTRRLTVALPMHKYIAWDKELEIAHNSKSISNDTLLSILGRLENAATVIQPLGHFLNNIRSLQMQAAEKRHNVRMSAAAREDLKLARRFLGKAREGISMNLLSFRKPDLFHIGDASEHGMGGFDSSGRAWRYLIPQHLRGRAHINLLEFLTQLIGLWLAIEEGRLQRHDCILAMGDSTTALGWLRRSNFREDEESPTEWKAKQRAARKVAHLLLDSDTLLYRQWFRGKDNDIADSLSRDLYYLSPQSHERFLKLSSPSQLPANFQIRQLPAKICCFISSVLQQMPVQKQRLIQPSPSELARGNIGSLSYIASGSTPTCTSPTSTPSNEISSCQPSHKPCERDLSLQDIVSTWWKTQSSPPSHMWHRPSGQSTGQTRDWTRTEGPVSY